MALKTKITGGLLGVIGFLLSPLSWWNDLLVNVPLAVAFGWIIGYFYPPAFKPAVIVGYWLTNVLGFWLMHKGNEKLFDRQPTISTSRRWVRDLSIAAGYTVVILVLLKLDLIRAPGEITSGK